MGRFSSLEYGNASNGPRYMDPNVLVKRQREHIGDEIDRLLSRSHRAEDRDVMVDRMYADFQAYGEKDNVVLESEFQKFIPLYSNEMRAKIENRTATQEDIDLISDLSLEFSRRFNLQKPTHVVDHNGKEVMPTLPPVLRRLEVMRGGMVELVNQLHTAFANDDGQIGGLNDLQKTKAVYQLGLGIQASQIRDNAINDRMDYIAKEKQLKLHMMNKEREYISGVQQETQSLQPSTPKALPDQSATQVNEWEMEYEPVEE